MDNTNTNGLEQTLQDGKLYRHVNALIVAHLRDSNFNQVTLVNYSTDSVASTAYLVKKLHFLLLIYFSLLIRSSELVEAIIGLAFSLIVFTLEQKP